MITSGNMPQSRAATRVGLELSKVLDDLCANEESMTNDTPIGHQATPWSRGSAIIKYFAHC